MPPPLEEEYFHPTLARLLEALLFPLEVLSALLATFVVIRGPPAKRFFMGTESTKGFFQVTTKSDPP